MNESADKIVLTPQFLEELKREIEKLPGDYFTEDLPEDEAELQSIASDYQVGTGMPDDNYGGGTTSTPSTPAPPPVLSQPLEFPWPLTIDQTLVFIGDRSVAVNLSVAHPDILGASDYEIRVTQV